MKNKFTPFFYLLLLIASIALTSGSCSKDATGAQVALSYDMLKEKTWFLDYTQSIVGTTVTTKSYIGQSTYFINFLEDRTTTDSDGISGKYNITNTTGKLSLVITGQTLNGSSVSYEYQVESMGAKNLVLSFVNNGTTKKMFYTAR